MHNMTTIKCISGYTSALSDQYLVYSLQNGCRFCKANCLSCFNDTFIYLVKRLIIFCEKAYFCM